MPVAVKFCYSADRGLPFAGFALSSNALARVAIWENAPRSPTFSPAERGWVKPMRTLLHCRHVKRVTPCDQQAIDALPQGGSLLNLFIV